VSDSRFIDGLPDAVILKSRILLLDERGRTLLFFTRADVPTNPTRWLTPGGHLEPGESHHEAAVRELFEETGLEVTSLGKPFWARDFVGEPLPGAIRSYHEEWYLWRVGAAFDPLDAEWTPEEHVDIEKWRWWSDEELEKASDPVEPGELLELFREVLRR
jgi:8-oxo-dGTP pyrophosphatase MutT (NUDIX family)